MVETRFDRIFEPTRYFINYVGLYENCASDLDPKCCLIEILNIFLCKDFKFSIIIVLYLAMKVYELNKTVISM